MTPPLSDRAQFIAEALEDIDEAIQEAKDAMLAADSTGIYQQALDAKVDLLRDRQLLVEQLEALGLEGPDL